MTNINRKWLYFSLGILTAILGWCAYTLYYIFGKPVLPTVKDNLTVDEDAEHEAALKQYSEAVMSLDPHSLDDLDDTQLAKTGGMNKRKQSEHKFYYFLPTDGWVPDREVGRDEFFNELSESEAEIVRALERKRPAPSSLDDLDKSKDDTQPIKIEQEISAEDLEKWAEYIG